MSAFKELDAARRERHGDPVGFRIRGQDFRCVDVVGAGVIYELLGQRDDTEIATVVAVTEFVRRVVVAEDWPRLQALLVAQDDPIDVDELVDIAEHICDSYAGRPTVRPAASQPGPRSTGASSKDGSSSPAMAAV